MVISQMGKQIRYNGSALVITLIVIVCILTIVVNIIHRSGYMLSDCHSAVAKIQACYVMEEAVNHYLRTNNLEEYCTSYDLNGNKVEIRESKWGSYTLAEFKVTSGEFEIVKFGLTNQSYRNYTTLQSLSPQTLQYGGDFYTNGIIRSGGDVVRTNLRHFLCPEIDFDLRPMKDFQFEKISGFESISENTGMILNEIPAGVLNSLPELSQEFEDTVILVRSKNDLVISDITIKGAVILEIDGKVMIKKTSTLKNTLIICEELEIERGFSGRLQAFCHQNAAVEDSVKLLFPSGISISGKSQSRTLNIGNNTLIYGDLVLFDDLNMNSSISLGRDTQIRGNVITNGEIIMSDCSIYGMIAAGKISSMVDNLYYPNSLFCGKIYVDSLFVDQMESSNGNYNRAKTLLTWLN